MSEPSSRTVHALLIRLDPTLYEQLRRRAHEDYTSKAAIIRDALRGYLQPE